MKIQEDKGLTMENIFSQLTHINVGMTRYGGVHAWLRIYFY